VHLRAGTARFRRYGRVIQLIQEEAAVCKLMLVGARFLSLCAVLLALPSIAAAQETVTAPFVNGPNGATTTNTYSGSVSIKVSGFGQAAESKYSDAFYIFTDNSGNPITPEHHFDFGLCINNQPVENYLATIPPFRTDHTYQFAISIGSSPQQITFGVCDTFTADNSGSFTITLTAGQSTRLKVTKRAVSQKAVIGGKILYTVVVKNNGNADATNTILEDKLPVELSPIVGNIMPSQGTCFYTNWSIEEPIRVHCDLVKLAIGEEVRINYAVGVIVAAWVKPGKIANRVTVSSDQSATATVQGSVSLVGPGEISAKELNTIIGSVKGCSGLFINYPFWDLVNLLIDKLNRQEITPAQFQAGLITATLDLIKLLTESHDLGLLSDLFSVPDCVKYGRLLFSIPD
jgi:uncharacterized repeat protein (TIGR01451 family)